MAAKRVDRDPPPPGRASVIEADRVDREHPKHPPTPVAVSTTPLAEAIGDLSVYESLDAPVVSVYWDVSADLGQLRGGIAKLKDLAKPIRERAASHELAHEVRASLTADADRLLELEALTTKMQGRTLALFRCGLHSFEEAVVLPGGLGDRVEMDATAYIRPLVEVQDEAHRYAVVVVDRERATLFSFYLGALEAQERELGQALRNPSYAAGDKEYGVHHKVEELAKRHYRDTANDLSHFVQEEGIELIVVGGHEETVSAFIGELSNELRDKVVGSFVIDPRTSTPGKIREAAERVVDGYERREEERLVIQALDQVGARGLGALGLEWCLLAANERAIDRLLVDATATAPGRVCDSCGWLGVHGEECPIDGSKTRKVEDVIDEMVALVLDSSGHVEHVHADTALHDHLVAALLRFPVPQTEGARI
ncbi:MAG: hypothetical protein JWM85_1775 [Acidimicrobiaceae bacterium]|nr:hypothetical protein [Acidimicrobiaceae bacterium]